MSPSISFAEFVSLLAKGSGTSPVVVPDGISFQTQANARFVEPTLTAREPVRHGTSLVLVSAPGAVGKSTVARELARRTGGLFWDLSVLQVGSHTFSGAILKMMGPSAGTTLQHLASGQELFVLDATDEAEGRAQTAGLLAFLDDVASLSTAERPAPVIVMLGRTYTNDIVAMYLADKGVPFAHYSIDYFDRSAAEEFITKHIDDKCRTRQEAPRHQQGQQEPYERARARLFSLAYRLLDATDAEDPWKVEGVRDFLGYAPVLEALADYLDVTNFEALTQDIARAESSLGTGDAKPWKFLCTMAEQILEREHGKDWFKTRLKAQAVAVAWNDWKALFRPDEQRARVLAAVHHLVVPLAYVPRLQAAVAQPYEEALRDVLESHPFRGVRDRFASTVFRDYLYAWALTQGDHAFSESLRRNLRSEGYRPTPLLARFLLSFAGARGPGIEIAAEDVGFSTSPSRQERHTTIASRSSSTTTPRSTAWPA